ncbi:MAG: PDZ domain-containing protein [Candidatus Sulfotelmatobacter sp.]
MRVHLARAVVIFLFSSLLVAQQQPRYFNPVAAAGQNLRGQAAANDGAFGMTANKSPDGFTVTAVMPGSPAETSGLKQGDVIKTVNGKPASDLSQMDFYGELKRKSGDSLQLVLAKAGQESTIELTAELRSKVYEQESKMPPSIGQLILDGHANVMAALAQDNPQRVFLWLQVSNVDAPSLTLDDAKFFVLDGQRQQLHHVTLPEIQYSIQTSVAQNMHSGSYTPPPPPSPQRQYTVNGTENGNYMLNSLGGGMATISGTSTSTYTVTPQPDYNQLGYSLGLAIRQMRDRKHDQKLVQEAQQTLNQWNSTYLKTDSPIVQGENRTGAITYWSAQGVKGPFRVVLFITDPNTKKNQSVTFDFQ